MSGNPYAAPKARVDDAAPSEGAAYFPVSITKLVVMSVSTLTLYQIYWFYKNWKAMQAEGERLNAPVRALFYPLTSYWLFRHIARRADELGVPSHYQAGWLAFALFLLSAVTWYLPDPWWLLGYGAVALLLPVQATVAQINAKVAPGADRNARFTGLNIVAIILGGLLLALAIVGSFLPQE